MRRNVFFVKRARTFRICPLSPSSSTLRKAKEKLSKCSACEEGQGVCAHLLVVVSVLLIFLTMPFSLCLVVKVVQVLHCLSSSFSLYLSSSSSFYLSSSSSLYMPSSFSLYFSSSSSCIYPPHLPDSLATTLKSRSRNVTSPTQSCVTWAQIYGGTILQVLYPSATLAQPCIFLFQCPVNAQPALTEPKFTCFVFCFLSCSCLFFSVCLFLKISCCTVFC